MAESEGKLDECLLDLDDITYEPRDSKLSFEDLLTLMDGIKEKITKNDQFELNTVLQTEQLYKNLKKIKDVVNSKSNNKIDEVLYEQMLSKRADEEKLNIIMGEYEKTIAKLVRDNVQFVKERDTLEIHLTNVEASFSNVHQKYERCKGIIENYKNNEEILKETVQANEDSIIKLLNKFDAVEMHTMEQLEKANNEIMEIKAKYEDEVLRLTATIKRLELKSSSLKIAVEQRNKENEELSRIFDDIISKVGN